MDKIEKYIAAEMRLIILLGYENPVLGKLTQNLHVKTTNEHGKPVTKAFPQWARDDGASFRLITEHNLEVASSDDVVIAVWDDTLPAGTGAVDADISEYPNKEAALRFAVISAVIRKLELASRKQS